MNLIRATLAPDFTARPLPVEVVRVILDRPYCAKTVLSSKGDRFILFHSIFFPPFAVVPPGLDADTEEEISTVAGIVAATLPHYQTPHLN